MLSNMLSWQTMSGHVGVFISYKRCWFGPLHKLLDNHCFRCHHRNESPGLSNQGIV
jgi:hypothetical protein